MAEAATKCRHGHRGLDLGDDQVAGLGHIDADEAVEGDDTARVIGDKAARVFK
jgi:hypothetical protein